PRIKAMDRLKTCAVLLLNSFAISLRFAPFVVLGSLSLMAAIHTRTHAITINMTYSNEGDPVPHPENPTWDPDGTILKAHFQAAKTIWESLLPGPGSYDFDFQWDDDISGLGLTSSSPLGTTIEIQPNANWFADPTPGASEEFSGTVKQKLYGQLTVPEQTTY